jgi:hypothetical protein
VAWADDQSGENLGGAPAPKRAQRSLRNSTPSSEDGVATSTTAITGRRSVNSGTMSGGE